MVGFYRYLFGFVRVSVSGIRKESFINFCVSHGISVWKIKPSKGAVELNISIDDYRHIREIRKAIGNDIHIKLKSKRGLPLKLIAVKKRSGIAVGIALALALNIFLSNYVWRVEVNGEIDVKDEILSSCERLGVTKGARRREIDTYFASQQLAIEYPQIAWCSVNIEGSVVTVNISPAKLSEEKETAPSNIVASTDGVIREIRITSGNKAVAIGDTVKKGQLLASGVNEINEEYEYIHSQGEIIAETYNEFKYTVSKKQTTYHLTGKRTRKSVFEFFSLKMPLYLSGVSGEYDTISRMKPLRLFGEDLPIGVREKTFLHKEKKRLDMSEGDAANQALVNLAEDIRKTEITEIISHTVDVKEDENNYIIVIRAACLENIAKQQYLSSVSD